MKNGILLWKERIKAYNAILLLIFLFFLSLFIYTFTLCPSLAPSDSAELTTAAYSLNITHPPGYPLFTLLGKLFTFIPLGNIPYRVNFMSAFFASLSVLLLFLIMKKLIKSTLISIVTSLFLAFTFTLWFIATAAEVWALFYFLALMMIFILISWSENKNVNYIYLLAFIFGLSLTSHQLAILFLPSFFLLIFMFDKKLFIDYKKWLICLLLFFLGLLLYLYIPIRSLSNPPINWGEPYTFKNFIKYILRLDYVARSPIYEPDFFMKGLNTYLKYFLNEFSFLGIILIFLGLIENMRKNWKIFLFLIVNFVIWGPVLYFYVIYKESYFIWTFRFVSLLAIIVLIIWLGYGLKFIVTRGQSLFFQRKILIKTSTYIFLFFILLIPLIPLISHFQEADKRNQYYAYDLGRNIIEKVDKNSLLITHGDEPIFVIWYFQQVEKRRNDVVQICEGEWFGKTLLKRKDFNIKQKNILKYTVDYSTFRKIIDSNLHYLPIYCIGFTPDNSKYFLDLSRQELVTEGATYRVLAKNKEQFIISHIKSHLYLWKEYYFRGSYNPEYQDAFNFNREIVDYYITAQYETIKLIKPYVSKEELKDIIKQIDVLPK